MKLVLLRHGESRWNVENRFTGWTDVELSEVGKSEAKAAGRLLKAADFDFDRCYTSYLKRAIHTLNHLLGEMERDWLPVEKSWKLNERHYGALQGLDKGEIAEKYGEDQVKIWRRSFATQPPVLSPEDDRNPATQEQYRKVDSNNLPLAESLKDTIERVVPYFEEEIKPAILEGERVVIVAHGNSLRALMMYLEHMTEEEIIDVNLPTGIPLVYELDENMEVVHKEYLGDPQIIESKMKKVADQGKHK